VDRIVIVCSLDDDELTARFCFAMNAGASSRRDQISRWTISNKDFEPRDETLAFPPEGQRARFRCLLQYS
jgi:hypothetical protein